MTPKERAESIVENQGDELSRYQRMFLAQDIEKEINEAVNQALEAAAVEIEALERGTYTSAQTPAGLVRAMKVK